jgi:signal transduction histidine kinase
LAFDLLKEKGELPERSPAVPALERGLQRTSELIDQTLQVARVSSGVELRRQPTTLAELVQELQLDGLHEAESKGVRLRAAVERDAPVDLDRRLVRSALGNLIHNGVKHTPAGGRVELRARLDGSRVVLEVEDGCGGLPPGKVEAAFAPFVRLDEGQDGFGLGLAIAKQAADAHGGSIRVQNVPGKGCIFVLELPIASGG